MQYRIGVQPKASDDIANAREWCNDQQLERGLDFLLRVDEAFRQIQLQPFGYEEKYPITEKYCFASFCKPYIILLMKVIHWWK